MVKPVEAGITGAMGTGRKQFFFEKKNQKTFMVYVHAAGESCDSDVKVFCFFSSEKKTLLPLLQLPHLRLKVSYVVLLVG